MTDQEIRDLVNSRVQEELKEITSILEFFKLTKFNFERDIKILNGKNIQVGKGVGTIIGTEPTQKLGFFGKAGVVQQSAITDPTGGAVVDAEARTKIIQIIDALQALGLVA